eukprot:scaffold5940_cov163-Skeletonema_marinoi.AAC.3
MGQCHSDVNSHSGTSLPPTISDSRGSREERAKLSKSPQELFEKRSATRLSYSPPDLILSKEVITTLSPTLSPPQSPDIVSRSVKTKVEEKHHSRAAMRFEESILIDVIDIPSKLKTGIPSIIHNVVEKTDQICSPPIPFQKPHKSVSPMAKNETEKEAPKELVLQVTDCEPKPKVQRQRDIKMIESAQSSTQMAEKDEDKFEALFKNTLRMVFACYSIMLACFFIMCKNAFNSQVANAPVAGGMGPAPAPAGAEDTERKDIFYFVRKIKNNVALLGEFSMNQDSVALLPLDAVKQLLGGSSEHAFETIHAELEAIDDNVLI